MASEPTRELIRTPASTPKLPQRRRIPLDASGQAGARMPMNRGILDGHGRRWTGRIETLNQQVQGSNPWRPTMEKPMNATSMTPGRTEPTGFLLFTLVS